MTLGPGITYIHEHITIDLSGVKQDQDARLDCLRQTVAELQHLKDLGVDNMVDVTARGMGRNTDYLKRVAQQAGIQVIPATGYYKEPFFPPEVYDLSEEQLAAVMIGEITAGIDETGLKAGVIGEIGSGQEAITPTEAKVFRAAALAHRETGAPIITHTTLGRLGLEQVRLLESLGVDLNRVLIGHVDLSGDAEYVLSLLGKGVYVAFDTVGKTAYQPESVRLSMLRELCRRGYAGRIMLSMDITRKSHLQEFGGPGYAYLLEQFVPYLRQNGITGQDITKMLVLNPRTFLNRVSP